MAPENKQCQNCKKDFHIDVDDFAFYRRIGVPSPTWCPECRMIRRFLFRNERQLFRRKEERNGKEIFSGYPSQASVKVYEHDFWWSDKWDPMEYGRDYDFSRPFFEQFRELFYSVPVAAQSAFNLANSAYCNNIGGAKNSYLCFSAGDIENCAYVIEATGVKDSLDLYEARHTELGYDNYMVDEGYRVFFSVNCEECTDIWFSKNLIGCSNCFGCINLRNKSYYIFNKPHTKESYQQFLAQFDFGSYHTVEETRKRACDFWLRHPERFSLAIRVTNSIGEHIERSKNLKYCYSVHDSENAAYTQFVENVQDSYDYTNWGENSSQIYESAVCGSQSNMLKFCLECWGSCRDLEYAAFCSASLNLFGCAGLRRKQYCILNKQYSQDDYEALRERIINHMNEKPYTDKQGRVYRYGEFFPPEFSPFAYNETLAQDFFALQREEVESKGFLWREPELREFAITTDSADLPDNIKDADESVLKDVISCASCGRAYRIIPMEFEFYKKIGLPLPRLCHNCRFLERFKFVNPPKWWHAKCQCDGETDDRKIYTNIASHPSHKSEAHCPNEFETSYAPGRPEIVYCEQCYKSEVA